MKVLEIAIEKIKPYWRNPRKRSAASIRKIADSIANFGWQQPIVVDADYVVIIGHGRLDAAKLLEQKRVPVLVAKGLSPEKVKALRLADNRVNRESDWDLRELMAEIDELKGLDAITLTGFDDADLKRIADDIDEASLEQIGAAGDGDHGDEHPFEADTEGDADASADDSDTKAESTSDGSGTAALSTGVDADGDDALVQLSEVVSLRQRVVVNAAIKKAQKQEGVERRGDALFTICELYLEEHEQ